jgi:hypothetical protein
MEPLNFRSYNSETNVESYQFPSDLPSRPGTNTKGKAITIRVNQYKVTEWPQKDVYQYDVSRNLKFIFTASFSIVYAHYPQDQYWQWCREAWLDQEDLGVQDCPKQAPWCYWWHAMALGWQQDCLVCKNFYLHFLTF